MKVSKSQRSNLIFIGIIAIVFFTPIGGKVKEITARLLSFSPKIERAENRIEISNYAWNLVGINTNDYNFLNAHGKVVVVNFWATWCPPCRAEMPSFQKLYIDYKDDVVFLFITNEDAQVVKKYLGKKEFDLPSYNQQSIAPKEFLVSSIPATYIIDKKGSIVVDKVGPADWDSDKIRDLLDKLVLQN